MFVRTDGEGERIAVLIDGTPFEGRQGDSVAAVLLLAGKNACRGSSVSGELRGPYCMMGVCFECLVSIDGIDGLQACMIPIRRGMKIETSVGRPEVAI
jgi:predicted molibdopterin-dependent oxidoreductase YjgC